MFEYFTTLYFSIEELQQGLTEKGKENWRLHTCEQLRSRSYLVVMDRIIKTDDSEPEMSEKQEEGMACKG